MKIPYVNSKGKTRNKKKTGHKTKIKRKRDTEIKNAI